MNSLYGKSTRKDIDEEYFMTSGNWLVKNDDEKFVDYESEPSGEYVIICKSDPGIDKIEEDDKCMPSRLCIFVLSHNEKNMNSFVHDFGGFSSINVYFHGTDSLYIHMNHYENLKEAGYV